MQSVCLVLLATTASAALYTPSHYAPSAYYHPGSSNTYVPSRSSGKMSKGTRDQVAGLLKGILGSLMKQKSAFTEVSQKIVSEKLSADVTQGFQGVYNELETPTSKSLRAGEGLGDLMAVIDGYQKADSQDVRLKVKQVLAAVLSTVSVAAPDPCKNIVCPDLKCPATFVNENVKGHCCGYCAPQNPALIKDTKDYGEEAKEAYATYKTAAHAGGKALIKTANATVAHAVPTVVAKVLAVSNTSKTQTEAKVGMMTEMTLGPFDDHVGACQYCYASHTKASVVKNCICTAYTGDSGPTMFCTASQRGVNYASKKNGACRCTEKNMAKMGQTTCDPFE